MQSAASITTVAHVIQLAVAPVFLLTGVGAILSVLTNRLGRAVDRFRVLERGILETANSEASPAQTEMTLLSRRARLIQRAISLCTVSALLVCIVIASLFVGSVTGVEMSSTIASLFIGAMLALIAGLLLFLREISLSTGTIRVGPRDANSP